jgi:hypothetical protein
MRHLGPGAQTALSGGELPFAYPVASSTTAVTRDMGPPTVAPAEKFIGDAGIKLFRGI